MSRPERKILILTDWFIPGYRAGGPIRSVYNIINTLEELFCFSVITSDMDFGASDPYEDIQSDKWNEMNGFRTYYISRNQLTYRTIKHLLMQSDHDILYLNSLFSIYFTLIPLWISRVGRLNKKIVLAPRGMLGKGALAIKSRKKRFFLQLAKLLGLYSGVIWHASTDQEALEIQSVFGANASIFVAPNLVSLPATVDQQMRLPKTSGIARFVFISRISTKKNILKALHFFRDLDIVSKGEIIFDLYGPVEDEKYWSECKRMMTELREKGIHVNYKGLLPYEEINNTLEKYHFFLMPTSHENFGHAIIEALASGCPVIISDQTPWHNLKKYQCGWDVPLSDERQFMQVLGECIEMNAETYNQWSGRARQFVRDKVQTTEIVQKNRQLFEQL